jgi:acyl-CoA reductase-like NAD-dependent aldehyde dehydrogenase
MAMSAPGSWRMMSVAKISVTGSVPTGRKVLSLAGSHMKHATMELGGKSPLIVFDDADLENAIGGAMLGNFYSTGQVCSNGTRVFVQSGIHDRFVERLVERTKKIRIGDPLDPETQMGPLVNKSQHDKVTDYIAVGKPKVQRSPAAATCPLCRVSRAVSSSSRRCSPASPITCASPARRSSGR